MDQRQSRLIVVKFGLKEPGHRAGLFFGVIDWSLWPSHYGAPCPLFRQTGEPHDRIRQGHRLHRQ
ncbi:hypothetical protein MESS2_1130038 [Mesorhizobium metallidurans STM 2683]|uniref:Uncharacterized protein n=1 Tax=Mesorhizobium metallidurans STM 2683 TaxID=1297569 RepID=M5EI50_9HYPH|nr:hypothetical protein MESS2_1130038 [Mesorhizobium metallidurans STM 2683]